MTALDAFFLIRRQASSTGTADYRDRQLKGTLRLDAEVKEALNLLFRAGELVDSHVGGKLCPAAHLPITGPAEFTARAPKAYFENLDELIERHPHSPPADFRIFDESDKRKFPLYQQAASLAGLLHELADNKGPKNCTLFASGPFEIVFTYNKSDLRLIEGLDQVAVLMVAPLVDSPENLRMLDVYRGLFKQALADVLGGLPKEQRFKALLANFAECEFRFRMSFRRFSDEANTAIERYEETRAGMITALNSVLGNIQTSLIGIPLAGLLALKEMKPSTGWTFENVTIATAVVIVGGLLMALSFSQGKSLEAIKEQHDHLKNEIDDAGGARTRIARCLDSMAAHHRFVAKLLIVVRFIIGAFVVFAVGVLFKR